MRGGLDVFATYVDFARPLFGHRYVKIILPHFLRRDLSTFLLLYSLEEWLDSPFVTFFALSGLLVVIMEVASLIL